MSHQPKSSGQDRFDNSFQKKTGKNTAGGNQRSGFSANEKSNLSGGGNRGQQNAPRTGKKPTPPYNRSDSFKQGIVQPNQNQNQIKLNHVNDAQEFKNHQFPNQNGNSWPNSKPQSKPITIEPNAQTNSHAALIPSADSFGPLLTPSLPSQTNASASQSTGSVGSTSTQPNLAMPSAGKLSFAAAAASALKNSPQTTPKEIPKPESNSSTPPNLQFGSFGPDFNGLQIPPRTTSAPPNLDEQKRAQAKFESSRFSENASKLQPQQQKQPDPQQQKPPEQQQKPFEPQKQSNQQPPLPPQPQQNSQTNLFQQAQSSQNQSQNQSQKQQNQSYQGRSQSFQRQNSDKKSQSALSQQQSSANPPSVNQVAKQLPGQQVVDSVDKNRDQSIDATVQQLPNQIQSLQKTNDVDQAQKTNQRISNHIQQSNLEQNIDKNENKQSLDNQIPSNDAFEMNKVTNQHPSPPPQQQQAIQTQNQNSKLSETDNIRPSIVNKDQPLDHTDPNQKRQNLLQSQPQKSPEMKLSAQGKVMNEMNPHHSGENRHHEMHVGHHVHPIPHQGNIQTNVQKNSPFVHDDSSALQRNTQSMSFSQQMHHGVSNNGPMYNKNMHSPTMNQMRMPFHPSSSHHTPYPSPNLPYPDRSHSFPPPQHQSAPLDHPHHFNSDNSSHMSFPMPPDMHAMPHGQMDDGQFSRQPGMMKQPMQNHMRQSVLSQQLPMHQQTMPMNPNLAGSQQGGLTLPNVHPITQSPLSYNQPTFIPSSHNPLMQQMPGSIPTNQVGMGPNLASGSNIHTQFIPTPIIPPKPSRAIKIMDPKTHKEIKIDKPKSDAVSAPPPGDNLSVSPVNSQGVNLRSGVPTATLPRPSLGFNPVNTMSSMYNPNYPLNPVYNSHGRGGKPMLPTYGPNQSIQSGFGMGFNAQVPLGTTQNRDVSIPNPMMGKPGPNAIPIMMPPTSSASVPASVSVSPPIVASKPSVLPTQHAQIAVTSAQSQFSVKETEPESQVRSSVVPPAIFVDDKSNVSAAKSTVHPDASTAKSDVAESIPVLPQQTDALGLAKDSKVEEISKKLSSTKENADKDMPISIKPKKAEDGVNDATVDKVNKESTKEKESKEKKLKSQLSLTSKPNSKAVPKPTEEKKTQTLAKEFELGSGNLDKFPPLGSSPQKSNGMVNVSVLPKPDDSLQEKIQPQVESEPETAKTIDPVQQKPQEPTALPTEAKDSEPRKLVWGKWVPDPASNAAKAEIVSKTQPESNSEEKGQKDATVSPSPVPSVTTVPTVTEAVESKAMTVEHLSTEKKEEGKVDVVQPSVASTVASSKPPPTVEVKAIAPTRSDNLSRGKKDKKKGGKGNQKKNESSLSEVKYFNDAKIVHVSPSPSTLTPPSTTFVSSVTVISPLPEPSMYASSTIQSTESTNEVTVDSVESTPSQPIDKVVDKDESKDKSSTSMEKKPLETSVIEKKVELPIDEEKNILDSEISTEDETVSEKGEMKDSVLPVVVDDSANLASDRKIQLETADMNGQDEKVKNEKVNELALEVVTESESKTQTEPEAIPVNKEEEKQNLFKTVTEKEKETDLITKSKAEAKNEPVPEPVLVSIPSAPSRGGKKKMKDAIAKKNASDGSSDMLDAYKISDKTISTEPADEVKSEPIKLDTPALKQKIPPEAESQPNDLDDWEDADEERLLKPESNFKISKPEAQDNLGYSRDFLLSLRYIPYEMSETLKQTLQTCPELVTRNQELGGPGGYPGQMDRRGSFHRDQPGDTRWQRDGMVPGGRPMGQVRQEGYGGFRPGGGPPNQRPGPGGQQFMNHPNQQPGGGPRGQADRWEKMPQAQRAQPNPRTSFPPIHKTDNRYEVGKVSDEEQKKQRVIKSILNKLTPQNFDKLFEQVKEANIDSPETLTGVISQIFDKALLEPTFCELYAHFCQTLADHMPHFGEDKEKITFKRVLLNKCQEEFQRNDKEAMEAEEEEGEDGVKISEQERAEKKVKARRKMLGNIRFIGELFRKKMLTEKIMHECIKKLLGNESTPDEENVEALCKLMSTIGLILDHPKAKEHVDAYMHRIGVLSKNESLSIRHRFMLKDLLDLRSNRWEARRKVEGPKKIEDVHKDAKKERQEQVVLAERQLERSGGGGRSGRRDFGSGDLPRSGSRSGPNPQGMESRSGDRPSGNRFGGDRPAYPTPADQSRPMSMPQRSTDVPMRFGPQGSLGRSGPFRGMAKGDTDLTSRSGSRDADALLRPPPNPSVSMGFDQSYSSGQLSRGPSSSSLAGEERGGEERRGEGKHAAPARPSVQSAPSVGRPSSSPASANSVNAKTMSEEELEAKCKSILNEYFSLNEPKEARECLFLEVSPSQYDQVMHIWIKRSIVDVKDADRQKFTPLLQHLCAESPPLVTVDHLLTGFVKTLKEIEDLAMDAPKASNLIGSIIGTLIASESLDSSFLTKILADVEPELDELIPLEEMTKLLISAVSAIQNLKGEEFTVNLLKTPGLKFASHLSRSDDVSKLLDRNYPGCPPGIKPFFGVS